MPKDVIITPASGLVDFQGNTGISSATIQLDDSGNLNITNPGGNLTLGDTSTDIFVGDGVNNVDIVFEQDGEIRGLTNKTVSLGQTDSYIKIVGGLKDSNNQVGIAGSILVSTGAGVSWTNSLGVTTFTGTVSFGTSAYFGDNDVAYFGDGNDLQIYHDGSNSYVADYGTGKLVFASNGAGVDIIKAPFENIAKFNTDGAVELYYDNVKEFETTGYGATVYGVLQSQGLNVTGITTFSNNINVASGIITTTGSGGVGIGSYLRLKPHLGEGGEIAFDYTNGNAGYYLDVSAGNAFRLSNYDTTGTFIVVTNSTEKLRIVNGGEVLIGSSTSTGTASQRLQVTGGAYIQGNVGVGATNPQAKLQVTGQTYITNTGASNIELTLNVSGSNFAHFYDYGTTDNVLLLGGSNAITTRPTSPIMAFGITSQNVGIGTTNPTQKLDVVGNIKLTGELQGPSNFIIDPAAVGDNTGSVRIRGDLYVDGTQTFINSTTIELADFNVGIATTVGTDALLDGAGIGIGSTGIRKTLTWDNTNTALKSSENFNLATGKVYEIDGTTVLSSNTLGSGVVNSSLTSVGTLTNLSVGNVNSTGVVTASNGFVGNLTGTATTATNLSDAANITTGTINSARLSGTYNIDITGSAGYATTAGIATYATSAGIATYATSSGIATYADYATTAGIATYATSAGLSTNVKGDGSRVLYNSATDTTTTSSNLTFDGTTLAVNSTPGANTSAVLLTGTPFGSNTKNGLLGVGTLGFTDNNIIANFATNVNSYAQVILQNLNSGNAASSDFIVNSDSPLGQDYYGDFGINGTAYNGGGPFGDTSGTYLYAKGGTLAVGTDDAQDFRIATGSAVATPVTRVTVTGTTGNVGVGTTTPSSKLSVVGDGNFTGVVTATSFSGSGTNLTGIVTSIVAGTNITISGSTGQVTINSTATGGGGGGGITEIDLLEVMMFA